MMAGDALTRASFQPATLVAPSQDRVRRRPPARPQSEIAAHVFPHVCIVLRRGTEASQTGIKASRMPELAGQSEPRRRRGSLRLTHWSDMGSQVPSPAIRPAGTEVGRTPHVLFRRTGFISAP